MSPALLDKVTNEILPLTDWITLSGYGEPLMNPRFPQLLDRALALGKKVGLITNGLLLNDAMADKLFAGGCAVCISMDGATNETMRHVRGRDVDQILDRIAHFEGLRAAKPDTSFRLTVICVLLRCNIEEIPELIRILSRYGVVDKLIVQDYAVGERDDAFAEEAIRNHKDLARRLFPVIREAARQSSLAVELPTFSWMETKEPVGAVKEKTTQVSQAPFRGKCYTPWFDLYIDVDGNVRSCCWGQAKSLGSLESQSFRQIWNGKPFRELRKTVNSPDPPAYCRICSLRIGINAGEEPASSL